MVHDMLQLDGEVPETLMSGESAKISQFCEQKGYEWVKFCSTTISFPEDPLVLENILVCPLMLVLP